MIQKSLIVSFISFLIFYVPMFLFSTWKEVFSQSLSFTLQSFIYYFIFGAIPIIGIIFITLLILNWILSKQLKYKSIKEKNIYYFLYSSSICLVPIFGFVIFDYSHAGRYFGNEGSFTSILSEYSIFFLLAIVVILLNRKMTWKNFSHLRSENEK